MAVETKILDGTGQGNFVKVDNENRLLTRSITESDQLFKSQIGESYQFGTGIQTLTNDTETAVIFIRNNEDRALAFNRLILTSRSATGSTDSMCELRLYTQSTNLTGGGVQAGPVLNNNIGSTRELSADILIAGTGGVLTDGQLGGEALVEVQTFKPIDIFWVVPRGNVVAFTLTAPAGNTSWDVNLILECSLVS